MNKPILALKLIVLAWLCVANVQATIRYVKPGSASTAWQTKTNVYNDLTSALTAAVYGDEIWVAAGTYKPTTGTDRNISFNLKNGVAIYGGFAGTETQLTQRNWPANLTILSGDIGVTSTDTDNSYSVVKAVGTVYAPLDNTTRLDGVVIEKGYANYDGGGAYFNYASPTIANTLFRHNFAGNEGGAIYATSSNSVIANTLFLSNKTNWSGGAVYTESALTFTHCTFANNRAEEFGGAVYNYYNSTSTITNSIAWGNSAKRDYQQFFNTICTYSCIEGGFTGTGNTANDPLFVDAANGDCRLNATSPCIDKGLNSATPTWLITDFYGKARLAGTTVDMGIGEGGVATPLVKTPANKTAFPVTVTSVALDWAWPSAQPTGITGYEIELQLNGGVSQLNRTNNMTYTISNIPQGSAYQWRVRGIDGSALKNWSPWARFSVKHATPLFVKQGGTGDGLSWATAMGSIQTAIDAAVYSDEIWVAAGTYKPTTGTDRTISINLKNGVAIYGGFAGTETQLAQRNWITNPTVLSGDIGVVGADTDNSYIVVKGIGTEFDPIDNTTGLDGVIIEKGYSTSNGAGAYLAYANPIVTNTIFRNNYSSGLGGALYTIQSNAVFANTIFAFNKSMQHGGAVYSEKSSLLFVHGTFLNNQSGTYGGAVYNYGSTINITNSIAWGNSANKGDQQFGGTITSTYSCVEGGYSGTGNISSAPLFIDAGNGDYRLNIQSPCIEKGSNTATQAWLALDYYGNNRLLGTSVDIGHAEGGILTPIAKLPVNNSALPRGTTTAILTWEWPQTLPTGITGYEIELQLNSGASQYLNSSTTTYTLKDIVELSTYKWRVRAIDGSTFKNWSPWAIFIVGHAKPFYVKPGGTGNGSSWAQAMGSLQAAIDAAVYGDEVWVAAGTYKPTTTTDRSISFNLKDGVAIYGGFAGTETQLAQRNWIANPTILSGDIGVAGTDTDNSYQVVRAKGTSLAPITNTTRLDGLIIEKGYNSQDWGLGGAMELSYANPIIANSVFRNNYASSSGGAVYSNYSSAVFANTLFISNITEGSGGAVRANSALTFTNCTFANNKAASFSTIYSQTLNCTVTNCIAWGNIKNDNSMPFTTVTCTYSCVEGGYTGTGNISSDPLFIDAANGDFRIKASSPCIEKGVNGSVPGWLNTDFLGNTRLLGSTVDMGITEGGVVTPTPKAPINNAFLPGTTTTVNLEWEWQPALPTGVTGYELEIQLNGRQSQFYTITDKTTYTLNEINPASIYRWRVRGINGTTYKDWSLWATFTVIHATPLYVKPGGTGNGLSWNTAMGSIQTAIDAAFYGDTICVAAGTYKPTATIDRTISFNLKNGVAIFGGFTGTETQLAQRNWFANPTILSGDIGVAGLNTDNSYRVIKAVGTSTATLDNNTRLDGLVVEQGFSEGNDGAGLYLWYAQPTITNTIFRNNNSNRWGGACYAGNSNAIFTNTLFVSNNAYRGGAVYTQSALTFSHCTFANNLASDWAGAVYASNGSVLTNCIAQGNNASSSYKQFYNTTCTYSCIEGGYTGTGNISNDPMFMDSANSDYRLQVASPCIDKGLNSATPTWLTTDYYGNVRLIGTAVDMGIGEGGVVVPSIKAPISNAVLTATTTSTVLEWEWQPSLPIGISGYEIEVQLNGVSQFFTSDITTYTLNGLTSGSSYKWRVRGINGTMFKDWSPWATFAVRHAGPIHVKTGGTGSGLSWSSALGSLQTAIDAAFSGDTIWVAAGTYKPTTTTDRTIGFNLKNGVAIYGGFAGTETELAQRNWVANSTILSGDIGVSGTDTDNSYSVIKAVGTATTPLDNTTRIDGVVIEKGYSNDRGGGAYLSYASPTIANTLFRNNFANYRGGAMYAANSNSVVVNTLFHANKSNNNGGAVYTELALSFTHCIFANNRSENYGGAVYSLSASSNITNSIAWGNSAKIDYQQLFYANCTYSCIEGGYTGTGNINSNPLFVDAANGNFRLQHASPCINKALATATPAWVTTDLDQLPRSINGNSDMGAYEAAYATSMSPGNNQAHAQSAFMGSMVKWDVDPTLSDVSKQQLTCLYELWKNGAPATIIAQGQNKGRAEVNINPLDFNASYQWRVGVKTAGYTYWSTPATFYIGRENPIYVKTNGTGDGSSWANALGSVSSALELANPGDRIWVAAGTYKPSGTGRDAAFKLKSNVELIGGYIDGGAARNPEQNITILSGDLGTPNDDSDNAYHVINNSYTAGTPLIGAVLDGFTITGGNAGNTNGGGMVNTYASPTIRYCKFIDNKAASGGAIANISSSPSIINSLLVKNTATAKGGAIYSDATSTPTIINNTIANNSAVTGGGLSGNGTVGNTIVYDNTGGQIEGTPTLTYSCVQGGFTGTGNITAAPRFKDADKNNYAIGPFSSCFDKGNSNLITTDFSTFDLSFSEMRNFVSSVDIGAYELKYPDIAARVEVTQATPANAATGIDYAVPIVLTFNEPVTIFDQLGVTMASGIAIKSMTQSDDKKTLTLVPSENWPFNSAQKLLIANGAIRFADNTNFRMLDYETGFGIRACLPVTVAIDLLSPTSCPGTLATMTTKTTGDVLDYEWMFKQSVVASGTPSFSIQKLTADSTGVYYCNVTDMCGNVASAQAEVEFTEGILKPVIVKKWNDVYLVDNSSKRFSNYQWYANDVEKESGSQYITVSNPWVGQSLYVTVFDNKTGCHSTSDKTTISLNTKSVSVYPNPVANNQSVEIQLPTVATNTRVRLFDANGNLKAEESIKGVDNYSFDKTNFAPGVYTMEIVEAEEKTIVKLIIQ